MNRPRQRITSSAGYVKCRFVRANILREIPRDSQPCWGTSWGEKSMRRPYAIRLLGSHRSASAAIPRMRLIGIYR